MLIVLMKLSPVAALAPALASNPFGLIVIHSNCQVNLSRVLGRGRYVDLGSISTAII